MQMLAESVPMIALTIGGEEFCRTAKLVPTSDGKERLLYWRGADPEPSEFQEILQDLVAHLDLR